MAGRDKLGSLW